MKSLIRTAIALTAILALSSPVMAQAVVSPTPAAAEAPIDMALTFDDLPAHHVIAEGDTRLGIISRIIAALSDAGAPPSYGFINAFEADTPANAHVLDVWRASGNLLGNHSWSHANLAELTTEQFIVEMERNEPILQRLGGDTDWHWFRYPYLSEGNTPEKRAAIRNWLSGHHYRVASVTISFDDYAWNPAYARCVAKGDTSAIAGLEASYLAAAEETLTQARTSYRAALGRDIPLVLLLHVGGFDARMMPRLLALYKAHGVRFVSLDQAEQDPFYAEDYSAAASPQPLTIEGTMAAKGLTWPKRTYSEANLNPICA